MISVWVLIIVVTTHPRNAVGAHSQIEPEFSSSLSSGTYRSAHELWAAYDKQDEDEHCTHRFDTFPRANTMHPAVDGHKRTTFTSGKPWDHEVGEIDHHLDLSYLGGVGDVRVEWLYDYMGATQKPTSGGSVEVRLKLRHRHRRFVARARALELLDGNTMANAASLELDFTAPFLNGHLGRLEVPVGKQRDGGVESWSVSPLDAALVHSARSVLGWHGADNSTKDNVCALPGVACALRPGTAGRDTRTAEGTDSGSKTERAVRVVGIMVDTTRGRLAGVLAELAQLPWLETLLLLPAEPTSAGHEPPPWPAEMRRAACEHFMNMQRLRSLMAPASLPPNCTLPALEHIDITGSPDHDYPYTAHELAWMCRSPKLKLLDAAFTQVHGLPSCLAGLTELERIDVRGSAFGAQSSVPRALSQLTAMRTFIAFEQSTVSCPSPAHEKLAQARGTGPCRPSYLWKAWQETHVNPWRCPATGWRARFDDLAQPWWSWRLLETFWVDANFLHGTIPAAIADRWPRLRSLDLYDNDISGTIPASMARMTHLHQLLLHDNKLTGTVPSELFALPRLEILQLQLNRELAGCWYSEDATGPAGSREDKRGHARLALTVLKTEYTMICGSANEQPVAPLPAVKYEPRDASDTPDADDERDGNDGEDGDEGDGYSNEENGGSDNDHSINDGQAEL